VYEKPVEFVCLPSAPSGVDHSELRGSCACDPAPAPLSSRSGVATNLLARQGGEWFAARGHRRSSKLNRDQKDHRVAQSCRWRSLRKHDRCEVNAGAVGSRPSCNAKGVHWACRAMRLADQVGLDQQLVATAFDHAQGVLGWRGVDTEVTGHAIKNGRARTCRVSRGAEWRLIDASSGMARGADRA